MSKAVQRRRGTTAEHTTFTGALGELTVDTTKDTIVVHDGAAAGGFPLLREDGSNSALALGSAGTPSLKFTGDPNTGLYSPGADQVAISTGGTGRLFVDASGNVGVGAASSNANHILEISANLSATYSTQNLANTNSGGYAQQLFSIGGASGPNGQASISYAPGIFFAIGPTANDTTSPIVLRNNNAQERLRITSTGNVGIGTSSPNANLDVRAATASIKATSTVSTAYVLYSGNNTIGGFRLGVESSTGANLLFGSSAYSTILGSDTNHSLHLGTNATTRLTIDSTGNVGIGTSSPAELLELSATTDPKIRFVDVGNVEGKIGISSSTALTFEFAGSERARITSAGNVGIGTSTPTSPLHVYRGAATDAFVRSGNTVSESVFGTHDAGGTYIYNGGAYPIQFYTNTTERARIDSSGRLLVGTSSTSAASTILAQGNSSIGATGAGIAVLSRGEATPASGLALGEIRFTDNTHTNAAIIQAQRDGGTWSGSSKPTLLAFSTTADGAATPTERMVIKADGNVGIGTSAPAAKLDINDPGTGLVFSNAAGGLFNVGLLAGTGSTDAYVFQRANGPLRFGTNNIERVRIDSTGRLLVGTSTARVIGNAGGYNSALQVETTAYAALSVVNNSNDGTGALLSIGKSRGATVGSNTIVQSGDTIGDIRFAGADGSNIAGNFASITAQVDATPGVNDYPGRLVFSTTADGAATPTEQLRITNGGTVVYNQPAPAAVNTTATLTVANLTAKIITSTTAAAVTMTLPTGTDMDAGFSGLYTNMAFEWSVINTGATNAVTVQGGTGHTVVGSGTVAASNSGRFVSRRTAATTWVTYRLSS